MQIEIRWNYFLPALLLTSTAIHHVTSKRLPTLSRSTLMLAGGLVAAALAGVRRRPLLLERVDRLIRLGKNVAFLKGPSLTVSEAAWIASTALARPSEDSAFLYTATDEDSWTIPAQIVEAGSPEYQKECRWLVETCEASLLGNPPEDNRVAWQRLALIFFQPQTSIAHHVVHRKYLCLTGIATCGRSERDLLEFTSPRPSEPRLGTSSSEISSVTDVPEFSGESRLETEPLEFTPPRSARTSLAASLKPPSRTQRALFEVDAWRLGAAGLTRELRNHIKL